MVHLVSIKTYPSKKAFKEAVESNPQEVYVNDPSFIDPVSGSVEYVIGKKKDFAVTNEEKRSWFARVYVPDKGKYKGQIRVQ